MLKRTLVLATAVSLYSGLQAQQSAYFSDKAAYRLGLAENLYNSRILAASQYEYARQYFYNDLLSRSQKENAQFYQNIIAVMLHQNHAEDSLEAFMKSNPDSALLATANMPLADYYLAKKDFPKALENLQKINQYSLSKQENTAYVLKLGYTKFMLGDTKGAIDALEEAYKKSPPAEKGDVAYMLGHLYYAEGNTAKEFEFFDTLKGDEKFAKEIRPYYVQMYFNNKDYDEAISEGQKLLADNGSAGYTAEAKKIIGESYFMKGDGEAAYPFLKEYLTTEENPSENDLYEMGYVSSKLKKYDEAVSYYNQLISAKSPLAQNAYYQLGNAYLLTNKKQEALSAFRSAYQMDYDPQVKRQAHLQYAKLGYELGNPFQSPPEVLQSYLAKYPNAPENPELQQLLIKSYLYSGDYRASLAAIDKMPNSSPEIDATDQEVSFLLGTEEYNKSNFDEAEKYFLRSLQFNKNKETYNRAAYWLAQSYYQKGSYAAAISRFEKLLPEDFKEKPQLDYDLGYAYFKSKKFGDAQKYFTEYLKNPALEFKNDAELRLADTFYAENKMSDALAIYDRADGADDYTLFQKSMALGYKGDTQAKIANLKNLIAKYPDSEYANEARYEMATAYAAQDDFTESDRYLDWVIKNAADSDLVANAKIYKIQNANSRNDTDGAMAALKTMANDYRNSSYAPKILQVSKPIFMKNGDAAGYGNFAKSLGLNVESGEIGEINLSTAKNYFLKKDYKSAVPFYEKYLNRDTGADFQAQYELGESYYQLKNYGKAEPIFAAVATSQNDYREDAETRLAQIALAQNDKTAAKQYLEELAASSHPAAKNYANTELMKIYAEEKDFGRAVAAADAVLANGKNAAAVQESAKAVKARALMLSGKDKNAQAAYAPLEKSANPAVAAEALYAKAFYQNKAKAYKNSNETIFKLANNYASEEYWGAKSLLVMAKNYIGLKDKYQATYTISQILDNYKDFPDVVSEAQEIKKSLK